jgi:crotonobetainyl-CoA:carnitine CoA-transferase CaiB-like acyl-CoA transferase
MVKDEGRGVARRPLEGLRIVDFSQAVAGPYAAMLLADLGAEVIRVDDVSDPDPSLSMAPMIGTQGHVHFAVNRNKESVALDLSMEADRTIAARLAAQADAVIESFGPERASALGLDHETLSRIRPGLIHCSISAFGQSGPWRDKLANELVTQALAGAMSVTGEKGRSPAKMGLPLCEEMTSLFAAIGILAAVEKRARTGAGAHLDMATFDSGVAMLSYMANIFFATGASPAAQGSSHPTIYPYNAFRTADGYIVVAPFTQAFWRKFCTVIGREDLPAEERFKTFKERLQNRAALAAILDEIMLTRPSREWLAALDIGDVPNGQVNSVADALAMEQTLLRGMVAEVDHPTAGAVKTLGNPFHLTFSDESRFEPRYLPAPLPGQDSQAVLERFDGAPSNDVEASDDGSLPLEGIRVLDLTRMLAGPYGGMVLADLGAEVIKVEEPRIGDPTRRNIPFVGPESTYFMAVNRGKKSITLDLKTPEGHAAIVELVRTSDVIFENYRPGVMERLGLGYDALVKIKPDIILCSVSGYGQDGPLKEKISFDLVNQAMAGTMSLTGEPNRPPVRIGLPAGDLCGGIFGALGVMAALHERRRSGRGCHIDLSLHDLLVAMLGATGQRYLTTGETPGPLGSKDRAVAPHGAYRASDGYIVLAATDETSWRALTQLIDKPDLASDPRFADMASRLENVEALDATVAEAIAVRDSSQWIEAFESAGIVCGQVQSAGEALECEQAQARGIVFDYDHPTVGTTRTVGTPFLVNGRPWRSALPSPVLGQHNEELLGRVATAELQAS